jgi:hypothetical protein
MAPENDLDHEADISIAGDTSLSFAGEVRAVVRGCENTGSVSVKRQSAGGIAGWQSMGLVRDCRNTGAIEAAGAEQVGGIAGKSDGYLRACSANCAIEGGNTVGGIAGSGAVVTDCRSMVRITGSSEKTGAVLGIAAEPYAETENPRSGNLYLPVMEDHGGIDGISYAGIAQPLPPEEFLALEELDEMFRYATLTFRFEDGSVQTLQLPTGSTVTEEQLPPLPEKAGSAARWVCEDGDGTDAVYVNRSYTAVYTGHDKVIASRQTDENGLPLLLVQGDFSTEAAVSVGAAPTEELAVVPLEERESVQVYRYISVSEPQALTKGRMLLPQDIPVGQLRLRVWDGQSWSMHAFTQDGSYAVFAMTGGEQLLVLTRVTPPLWPYIGGAAAAVTVTVGGILAAKHKKRKKQAQTPSA